MANNNQNQTKASISLAEPVEFSNINESMAMSTVTLSKYINELFKGAFKDYVGCTIKVVQPAESLVGESISLDLYFAPNADNGKGSVAAFGGVGAINNAKAPQSSIIGRCIGHNQLVTTTSSMILTDDAVSMLYPLTLFEIRKRGLKENQKSFAQFGLSVETTMNSQYGSLRPIIYNIVRGIDINAIMKVIFGSKEKHYEFSVFPIKPIYTSPYGMQNSMGEKWIFNITKMDIENLNDIMNEFGFYNKVSDFGIMTEVF